MEVELKFVDEFLSAAEHVQAMDRVSESFESYEVS